MPIAVKIEVSTFHEIYDNVGVSTNNGSIGCDVASQVKRIAPSLRSEVPVAGYPIFICILERFDLNLMIEIIVKTSMSRDRPQVKTATDSHSGRLGLNG